MSRRTHHILVITGLVLLAIGVRVQIFFGHVEQPLQLRDAYVLEVTPGSNLTRIVRQLQESNIISASDDILLYARAMKMANQIKAGEYELTAGMTALGMLQTLVRGEVSYHQVTLVEGWTLQQVLDVIQAHPAIAARLPRDATALAIVFGTAVYPEGLFFPDTYNFTRGTTDYEILERARTLMNQMLDAAWAGRASGLPLANPMEALVLASIVEKETSLTSEYGKIAGVFTRRLQLGMRLQTDPTVIYGLGSSFDGNLTRAHLQGDTPWNTYVRSGLPPTPIALPGKGAIEASLHPEDGTELYFVARGDGSHHFSATLDEHNRAVSEYQLGNPAQRTSPP